MSMPTTIGRLGALTAHLAPSHASQPLQNRRVVVKRTPDGLPSHDDFELLTEELPPVQQGQMLLRVQWASVGNLCSH